MNYIFFDENLEYPKDDNAYGPSYKYPEYLFGEETCQKENKVYDAIRKMMQDVGYDEKKIGSEEWNPLGQIIEPGMNVLIKPNFVMHKNGSNNPEDLESLVTHPSIIRCIVDYCLIALKGKGNIWVADSPVKDCDFSILMQKGHYSAIEDFYKKQGAMPQPIFCDLRGIGEEGGEYKSMGVGVRVNLGERSYFYNSGHDCSKYRVPNYDYRNVCKHHFDKTNEYMLNSLALDADVIISLPKPKTHRKNGYTGALKNFIGINYSKEYLPHHRSGVITEGGDEYKITNSFRKEQSELRDKLDIMRTEIEAISREGDNKELVDILKKEMSIGWTRFSELTKKDSEIANNDSYSDDEKAREGSWHGNDTLWRTVLDLNLAVLYSNKLGVVCDRPQRKIIYFGDMVISGEGEGPLAPTPKKEHVLLFSENAVSFDAVLVAIMGFDSNRFEGLSRAEHDEKLSDEENSRIRVMSNVNGLNGLLSKINLTRYFKPFKASMGWKGYI